ncbi:MAG: hypothetical protein R6V03_04855 [Kiritimatiellia bacterium]
MAEDSKPGSGKKEDKGGEDEVWSAIAAFEQILEAMPNDRTSLETLAHAYAQIGDHARARDYMIRLARVVVDEKDSEAARDLAREIKAYAEDDDDAKQLQEQLENTAGSAAEKAEGSGAPSTEEPAGPAAVHRQGNISTAFDISEEMSFAWNLLEAQELSQEEYASVVQDLTEMSAGETSGTISLLHVLEGRAFKNLERILVFAAKKADAPVVSLSSFDVQREAVSLLPIEFVIRRGAVVFELLGNDAMAAVMNPFDRQLRQDVREATGRKCHFFLTRPTEFDQAIEKARKLLAGEKPPGEQ